MAPRISVVLLLGVWLAVAEGFVASTMTRIISPQTTYSRTTLHVSEGGRPRRRNPNNEDNARSSPEDEIPQLPSFGGSSFDATAAVKRKFSDTPEDQPALVDRKFELQYTCKVCDTRNSHKVSRIGTYLELYCTCVCIICILLFEYHYLYSLTYI